ncbi:PAS domain-containing sensor histidine kinase [Methanococcoides burtonii]|uniref:histidine kinase n=1 Tax=Methanococcoides burtonii (strain DSM 6242 / NBRC 107633 / OCM 468 / ACE-M) TaxID=259564 RepID=Q12XC9_METBU|nr:PAS domain-containing sensor histidine kinase [Methanococcoides burtonii]ABE51897.1 Multisensor signal transduction histidine kinase [Methanococcoides burtonii DSM 6242]
MFINEGDFIINICNSSMFNLWEDNIVIINPDGFITYTNKNWESFAKDNGLDPSKCSEGTNYLKICDEANGEHATGASIEAKGIIDVINGNKDIYKIEYPCHSPDEKRWFLLKATPLSKVYPTDVLLQHINITDRKEVQIKLKNSEQQFRNVLENIRLISITLDTIGNLIFCNEYFLNITGWKKEEIIHKNWFELFVSHDIKSEINDMFRTTIKNNSYPTYYENEILTKNCEKKIIAWNNVVNKDQNDKILSISCIGEDVTEKRQYEINLRKFKSISDRANYGSATTDLHGNVTYINDYFAYLHGYSPDELIGKNLSIFHSDGQLEEVHRVNEELMENGSYTNIEIWHTHKNGTTFPMLMSAVVMKDEGRNPQYLSASAVDITHLKNIEDRIYESEKKYSSLVENGNDGIIIIQDGLIKYANRKMIEMSEYSHEELIENPFIDFVSPKYIEIVKDRYQKRLNGEDIPSHYEIEIEANDDRTIPVDLSVSIINYQGLLATMAILRDISDWKQAKAALIYARLTAEEANRTKTEFLANVSHELRTPLNPIIGFSDILVSGVAGELNEKQKKYALNIKQNGSKLLTIVNRIIDMCNIRISKLDLKCDCFKVIEMIIETKDLLNSIALKKKILLDLHIDPELNEIVADKTKTREILYNLIENAIKFTPSGGHVSIHAIQKDDYVQISVTDTGIGIAHSDIGIIFRPFLQVDSSTTRQYDGVGLGLMLVKEYVKLQGGDIWVDSELGKGSTFTFTLPMCPMEIGTSINKRV